MRQPNEPITRADLIRELATLLVTGRNCKLLGPSLLAKTPLLRDLKQVLASEVPEGLVAVLIDLDQGGGRGWGEVGRIVEAAFKGRLPGRKTAVSDDWHLSDVIRSVLSSTPTMERLVLLFDHLEELSRDGLVRLATECSGIVNLALADASLSRVSMLWCGDESRIAGPIAQVQGFPRISEVRYVEPYGEQDMDGLLEQYTRTFYLPADSSFRQAVKELTGGLPGLARHFGDSFMAKLVPKVSARFFPDAISTAEETAERYHGELMEAVGVTTPDRQAITAILANEIVDRISASPELLSLVLCMRMNGKMTAPRQEFPWVLPANCDLFQEKDGLIQCRGTIIQRFIHGYFTLSRLALCFFSLDATRESWAKAMLCCQCGERDRRVGQAVVDELFDSAKAPRSAFRFLEALSSRLHGLPSATDVLDTLLLTIRHFLGAPACKVYEVAPVLLTPVACPANRLTSRLDSATASLALRSAPEAVRQAITKACPQRDEGTGSLAVPLQCESRVRYLLWVEPSGDTPLREELIRTAATLAEGPLSTALEQQRQVKLLREIVESNPEDRIQVIDRRRRIVLVSKLARADANQEVEAEVLGKRCRDVFGSRCKTCLCEQVFHDKQPRRSTQERLAPDAAGRLRRHWFDVHCWPLLDAAGEVDVVCYWARDMSASLATLDATGKLLQAQRADDVYDILMAAAEQMGFARGRLYLCPDPTVGMAGDLVSSRCFGHDDAFREVFTSHKRKLVGEKEAYWYDVFQACGSGVICRRGEHYAWSLPSAGELPEVIVPAEFEQMRDLANPSYIRAQTALVAEGRCYGTLVLDMGEQADHVPSHLSFRLFELAQMAAQTLGRIESRERLEVTLRGFRHSLALPVGKFTMMVDTCVDAEDQRHRELAGKLLRSAVDDMFRLSENLVAQFSGGQTRLNAMDQDVVPSVKDVIDAFQLSYFPFGVNVEYIGPKSVRARVDDTALRVILRNLLDNAVKAIQRLDKPASRNIEVRVLGGTDGRLQRIEVEDSGPGVLPDLGDSIYQVGVSTSSSSGIGLPACRYFAEMMGASIDNVLGTKLGGANFRLHFGKESQ